MSIGNLKNLRWLYLGSANLKREILESVSELQALETLDISNNIISGNFPKSIGKLKNLNNWMYWRILTGEIPHELTNLTLLREILCFCQQNVWEVA